VCITLPTTSSDSLHDQDVKCMSIQLLREIAVKCCLNAISTGAHVLKGKVYKNIMIDVKVRWVIFQNDTNCIYLIELKQNDIVIV
jgi:N-acetylmuramic acid 6-phosphate (MurNAc-6-P) etherase